MGCALGRRYSPPYTGGKACEVAFPVPRPNKLDCVSDEVIELYRGGKSLAEVAAVFGVAQTTVYTLLKKNNIARRPLSEANSIKWTEERKAKRARALRGNPSGALGKRWTYDRPITRPNSRGSLNPQWKGGKTMLGMLIRTSAPYRFWREAVFQRDKYTCVTCGAQTGNGHRVTLNADHIVPLSHLIDKHGISSFEEAEVCAALWDVDNGRTLCRPCHKATPTFGRNFA
jgi:hypothetical protein